MSINGSIKKRGRPATGVNTGINVRLPQKTIKAIDDWIGTQSENPSRPEAIRRLIAKGLKNAD